MFEYPVDSTFPTTLGPVGGQREEEKRDGARESICGRDHRVPQAGGWWVRLPAQEDIRFQRQGCHRRQGGTPRPDGGSLANLYKTKAHFR